MSSHVTQVTSRRFVLTFCSHSPTGTSFTRFCRLCLVFKALLISDYGHIHDCSRHENCGRDYTSTGSPPPGQYIAYRHQPRTFFVECGIFFPGLLRLFRLNQTCFQVAAIYTCVMNIHYVLLWASIQCTNTVRFVMVASVRKNVAKALRVSS